jgi:hypothetical protein
VAVSNAFIHPDLKSLSHIDHCSVESDEPDPRGWTVFTSTGRRIGTVIDLLIEDDDRGKAAVHVRYLVIDVDGGALPGISASGSTALVRIEDIDLDGGSLRVTARAIACSDIHAGFTPPAEDSPVTTV